ncbi:MAG: hypothetical protein ACREN2_09400 [Candidatus Dormibacteria bacterium]
MTERADGSHLESQSSQGVPGLSGVEVQDVEAGRASEDLLHREELSVDLDRMLPDQAEVAVSSRAQDSGFAQPDSLAGHDDVDRRLLVPGQ